MLTRTELIRLISQGAHTKCLSIMLTLLRDAQSPGSFPQVKMLQVVPLLVFFTLLFGAIGSNKTSQRSCCGPNDILKCLETYRAPDVWRCACAPEEANDLVSTPNDEVFDLTVDDVKATDLDLCLRYAVPYNASGLISLKLTGIYEENSTTSFAFSSPFWKLGHLDVLRLEALGMHDISGSVFSHLPRLTWLSLRGNKLSQLTSSMFTKKLQRLEKLDLSNNLISAIDICAFALLRRLEILDLSRNRLTIVETGIFANLNRLTDLDLSGNQLFDLSSASFIGLYKLNSLHLQENEIRSVDFSNESRCDAGVRTCVNNKKKNKNKCQKTALTKLQSLDLSGNKIASLESARVFRSLLKLQWMNLSRNSMSNISFLPFLSLCNLEKLNLSENSAESLSQANCDTIDACMPCHIETEEDNASERKVKRLDLSIARNKLSALPSNVFSNMGRIANIDASGNHISEVHANAFAGLPYLTNVNLSHNALPHFDTVATNLISLDLSWNSLTTASSVWLDAIAKEPPGKIWLGGNPLMCDRHLAKIFMAASCNAILESDKYKRSSLEEFFGLEEVLSGSSHLTLSSPGDCVALPQKQCESTNIGTDTDKCALQAYLNLASSDEGEQVENIFRRMLEGIERLYIYAKRAASRNETFGLHAVKQSIVKAITVVAEKTHLDVGDNVLGYLSDEITVGVSKVSTTDGRNFASPSNGQSLGFIISTKGKGAFVSGSQIGDRHLMKTSRTVTLEKKDCEGEDAYLPFHKQIEILLPQSAYSRNPKKHGQKIAFVAYRDKFLFPSNDTVMSAIVSSDVFNAEIIGLHEPVVIHADVDVSNESTHENFKYKCAYWSFSRSSWLEDGCRLVNQTKFRSSSGLRTRVTCHCDHLTNFGVLLNYDPSKSPVVPDDEVTNSVTYTGLIASIIGLAITIIYRLSIRELRRGVPQIILLHLCFCLLLVYILLLLHDKSGVTQNKWLCFSVGLGLHVSLLSVWGWQVIEGVSMYFLLVRVFNVKMRQFLTKSTVCCYLTAALAVSSSLIMSVTSREEQSSESSLLATYKYGDTCIVSYPNNLYFVVIPILTACLANGFAFILIIRALSHTTRSDEANPNSIRKRLRQAICVTSLLGITWFIGFIKVAVQSTLGPSSQTAWVFDVIFSACNSIQGFILFVMFCATRIWKDLQCMKSIERLRSHSQVSSTAINPFEISSGQPSSKV